MKEWAKDFPLIEDPFDLEFFGANAMCFIPVQLRLANRTINELHGCQSLFLTPSTPTVRLPEPSELPDRTARSDCHDLINLPNDFEKHDWARS
jgi:hypothetical protein